MIGRVMNHTRSAVEMNSRLQRLQLDVEVNGQSHSVDIEPRTTLLDVLREHLDLTGAKRACDRGECGACTVLVDDQPMYACHLLAMQARGHKIVTIEGLAERADFRPLLDAFVANDAGQCGFCTPGFAVAVYAALQRYPETDAQQLRWELVGHICRCNAYDKIVVAACDAGRRR
jgi:aerobic-type carbon monoxide dehydrogenase small subunit (CoxS/CutS family)